MYGEGITIASLCLRKIVELHQGSLTVNKKPINGLWHETWHNVTITNITSTKCNCSQFAYM